MKPQGGMLFAWEDPPASAAARWTRRLLATLLCGALFLLPLFGYLAAEPTPYRSPDGLFSLTPPQGWVTDDSGHMGPGLVAKSHAETGGVEPLLHVTHEPAGIVTLEVRWQTLLGQLRFDNERLKFMAIAEREDAVPPHGQTVYVYQRGGQSYQAVTRLVLAGGHFYHMTGVSLESNFDTVYPALIAAFDSLKVGKQ